MGSTVAPKMFSQPGVFGNSDTSAVVNKTNPATGLAGERGGSSSTHARSRSGDQS